MIQRSRNLAKARAREGREDRKDVQWIIGNFTNIAYRGWAFFKTRFGIRSLNNPLVDFCCFDFFLVLMAYATCIFCNRNDSKPSREHVIADWIAREFPDTPFDAAFNKNKRIFKTTGSFNIITKKPCNRCNTTWMSGLETTIMPILRPLMHGKPCVITLDQQVLLARWFAKTIIMFECTENGPFYFTKDECHSLMRSLSVPDFTVFFLAPYSGSYAAIAQDQYLPMVMRRDVDPPDPIVVNGYTATFVIKHLALQIFSIRRPPDRQSGNLRILWPDEWDDVSVPIWPPTRDINWPPGFALDDEMLERFTNRWATALPPSVI